MTEREQKYVADCQQLLGIIQRIIIEPGAKAVCINALDKHIREVKGMWAEPRVTSPDKHCFLIGLTFDDLIHLQNLGTIEVNPKDAGLLDMPTTIFLGGTHEHMAKGMAKHPDAKGGFVDSHGAQKN